ncbi:hypothetical protein BC833DRAFT_617831 [Globomyces pollinis-pini]|nr:hypothetical protein BC833DRAFT_617831 [Globomyces pollinis-pini]
MEPDQEQILETLRHRTLQFWVSLCHAKVHVTVKMVDGNELTCQLQEINSQQSLINVKNLNTLLGIYPEGIMNCSHKLNSSTTDFRY